MEISQYYNNLKDYNCETKKYLTNQIFADKVINVKKFFKFIFKNMKKQKFSGFDDSYLLHWWQDLNFTIIDNFEYLKNYQKNHMSADFLGCKYELKIKNNTTVIKFI